MMDIKRASAKGVLAIDKVKALTEFKQQWGCTMDPVVFLVLGVTESSSPPRQYSIFKSELKNVSET
jgi:hypothetical protein